MRRGLACVMLLVGCVRTSSVVCSDGSYCPTGTACRDLTDPAASVCANAAQIDQCIGKDRYARCDGGRCYDGVCLAIACGNGRVDQPDPKVIGDVGEVCDDGNATSGDGCSSDCRSNETCGNGVIDPIAGEQCDDGNAVQHDGCDSRCRTELPRWSEFTFGGPSARAGTAMAYDAARDRVVVFGGGDDTQFFDDTWEWSGLGWAKMTTPLAPLSRAGHSMIYDPVRRRVVLFGGRRTDANGNAASLNDTWEWDGTTWTPVLVVDPPRPRSDAAIAFDGKRGRAVMFGGEGLFAGSTVGEADELWSFDGSTWTALPDPMPRPNPELGMAMAYDPKRDRTVVVTTTETWLHDGQTWTQATGTMPPPRAFAALAWDPRSETLVLYGGETAPVGTVRDDAWSWDGTAWSPLAAVPFAGRYDPAMVTDVALGGIVMFGGVDASGAVLGETWQRVDQMWTAELPTAPGVAFARQGTPSQLVAAYDSSRGRSVVYGLTANEPTGGTWEFDGLGFADKTPATSPPGTTFVASMAYDEAREMMVLYRGEDVVWEWNGQDWHSITPAHAPSLRAGGTIGYDGTSGRVILFGGNSGSAPLDDTWAWDGNDWTELHPTNPPPPREDAALAWDPRARQLVMFGGVLDMVTIRSDTWVWNGSDWSARPVVGPPPRRKAAFVWNPSRQALVLFAGGGTANDVFADLWEWTASAGGDRGSWTQPPVPPGPSARIAPIALRADGGRGLMILGGFRGFGLNLNRIDDLWRLEWVGGGTDEACSSAVDVDGDTLAGCADPDCWWRCTPDCPPGTSCPTTAPACGDGTCNAALEDCHLCPADCACLPVCGDGFCDPGEACPGDCP